MNKQAEEIERLKKLVFDNNDEKDLVLYTILLQCRRLLEEYERMDKDDSRRDLVLFELKHLTDCYNNLK